MLLSPALPIVGTRPSIGKPRRHNGARKIHVETGILTTVTTAEPDDFLDMDDAALLAQCEVHTYRASGPGGQKRNKTSSAVRLHHGASGLMATGTESRSQHENKARALKRLRMKIALQIRHLGADDEMEISERLRACITPAGRLQCGKRDHRYPAVVRDVLDVFAACQARTGDAAKRLGISTAQLISFLRKDPKLWARANEMRTHFGHDLLR